VGQLGSEVWVRAGFQLFALTDRGNVLSGGNVRAGNDGGMFPRGMFTGKVLHS